jgi:hypothetical protein
MSRDKRAGVIRSDLYNNSIYSDKSDVSRSGSLNRNNIDNEKCSESCYSGIECFNDYSNNHMNTNDVGTRFSDNSSDKGDVSKTRSLLVCNLCKLDSHKDYIFLSCCNSVFHIKCLINKYTRDITSVGGKNGSNTNEHYEYFNENTITQGCFDKIICTNCDNKVNYEDIFTLYSKNILCNKKFHTQHITQLNTLKDQKTKIENEIRCLNEYITKLDNDKNMSKIIMDKTYKLLTD